jgi:hypothetical protein
MRMRVSVVSILQLSLLLTLPFPLAAGPAANPNLIKAEDLRHWLTDFSSDGMEGRATFSEGLGLAAAYIAEQLRSWGVRPGGDGGSYLQSVRVLGVRSDNHSTITVEAHGETRTFKAGEAITLPPNVGAKRTFTSDQIRLQGYGLDVPGANYSDYTGDAVAGKIVVFLGNTGPKGLAGQYRRLLFGRARFATEQKGALASIGPNIRFGGGPGSAPPPGRGDQPSAAPAPGAPSPAGAPAPGAPAAAAAPAAIPQQGGGGFGFGGPQIEKADFTTVERLDKPVAANITAQDEFFDFLFQGQQASYAELKTKATSQDPLPKFDLKGVKITVNLDADYKVVRTQLTRNVVGIVEGRDRQLKNTYVAFGAHYDHVGYSEGEIVQTNFGPRRAEARGRVKDGAIEDRFWNGADDDGSGSIALLGIAKAAALGPRPKRSLLFVWHTGEERGLYGSRYFADYPSVPIDSIVAQINMDMIGRNRDDRKEEGDSVYIIGSDRISTELHNITVDTNASMPQRLKLDFELNDPADPEQFYFRSDHYSYAAKGIPIIFLTTGLHPDYHANTDSVEKIDFPKMTRISRLAYLVGMRVGNLDHAPARDNRGPRAGRGTSGKIEP